jgi:hypothetical protein
MLRIIKDIETIERMQKTFESILKKRKDKKVRDVIINFQSNKKYPLTVYWYKDKKIFCRIGEHFLPNKNKFFNIFGISNDEPQSGKEYKIEVEINFSRTIKGRPNGTFAEDLNDNVFILHKGGINVSNPPINIFKQKYEHLYSGKVIKPEEIDDHRKYALVSQLSGAENLLIDMLADFIYAIKRAKQLIREHY